jgi:NAD(P)-dependent dehydrogenase (short-subunit alcohol dehydrogenase family)
MRRYVITGGVSGIGRICAQHLTAQRHRVWVTGTRRETVAAALAATGGTVCDVTDIDSVTGAFTEAASVLGGLDGAFLNAGIDGECLPAEQLSPENFRRVFDVNVLGVLNSTCGLSHP